MSDTPGPALLRARHWRWPAWSRSPSFLPGVLALGFTVAVSTVMSHHEMWRDEIMAWLMARAAAMPWQVFSIIKYEGHPGLWYLLMWPLAHLSWNPVWMQALHALIAGAAVFVLLRYGPFSWAVRVVLALGYFLAYEWAVISRNYAISVLLLFVFCALYGRRWRRFPALALVLLLLCHTNVHSLILVSIFFAVLLVEFPVAFVGQWDDANRCLRRVTLGFLMIAAGLVTAVVQITPPADSGTAREWVYEWQPERFQKVAGIFCRAYLPLPADRVAFWNGNRLLEAAQAPPPRPWFAVPLESTVPVAGCILGVGCLFFLKRPWMVVPYLLGSVALAGFFYVKYFGSLRNHGFLFLLFLVTVWLSTYYRPWHTSRSWIDILPDWWDRHRMKVLLFLGLIHVWGTRTAVRQDWREPFSNGRAAAAWIRAAYPERGQLVFAGDQAAVVSTVVGYLQLDRIFYLDRKEFGTHLKQDRRFGAMARPAVPLRVHDLAARENKSVLLVLSYRLSAEEMASLGGQFLRGFDSPSIIGESYYLYLYPLNLSTLGLDSVHPTATISVPIVPDAVAERAETFSVLLSSPVGAKILDGTGVGTIVNDDGPTVSIDDVSLLEGTGGTKNEVLTVSLSGPSAQTIAVPYATVGATASAPADYTARTGTLSFTPEYLAKTLTVPVVPDSPDEPDETFTVVAQAGQRLLVVGSAEVSDASVSRREAPTRLTEKA